jgi:hypothetical protein
LQDFEALTPNLLARTMETVEGGGIIVLLLSNLNSLTQLYQLTMDMHGRLRTDSHQDVTGEPGPRLARTPHARAHLCGCVACGPLPGTTRRAASANVARAPRPMRRNTSHAATTASASRLPRCCIGRFNERMVLSMASCPSILLVDDELNILPTSTMIKSIEPVELDEDGLPRSSTALAAQRELKQLGESLADTQVGWAGLGLALGRSGHSRCCCCCRRLRFAVPQPRCSALLAWPGPDAAPCTPAARRCAGVALPHA